MQQCTRAFSLALRDPQAANTCADLYANRAVALQYNEEFAAAIDSLQFAQRFNILAIIDTYLCFAIYTSVNLSCIIFLF